MILWQFSSTNSERWLSERICFASCLRKTYKILAEIPFQVVLSTEVLSERLLFVTLFMAVACCLQIVHLLAIVRDGAFWEGWLVAFLLAGAVNRGGADAVERSRKGPHCPVATLLSSLCKCNQSVTRCDFKHVIHIYDDTLSKGQRQSCHCGKEQKGASLPRTYTALFALQMQPIRNLKHTHT